ncbi:hypothetical protein L873DRAFT_1810038 [Choiromyces venosus 120613-1]|uniref:Secreted protein n=1 Tax=Choiromyces venosus 120613-1 TaxID=1336337 RepID=A0A3N4JG32_9PEZI|nr:hypothetical protein L873DRAFT_1810038 [Choiromyces venosus 120613-1]
MPVRSTLIFTLTLLVQSLRLLECAGAILPSYTSNLDVKFSVIAGVGERECASWGCQGVMGWRKSSRSERMKR